MRQRGFEPVTRPETGGRCIVNDVLLCRYPTRADKGSCGYDFYAPYGITLRPNQQKLIWTNFKAFMLEDEALILNMRSGHGELRIQLANTQGWIDSTYYNNPKNEGNIGIFIRNEGSDVVKFEQGDRIAQGMFIKYLTVDHDEPLSKERVGGFGSTGK